MVYNEVIMTNNEDDIELNCIINNGFQADGLDILWLKFKQTVLHKIDCDG